MTFEPIDWNDDEPDRQPDDDGLSLGERFERFKRYLAARRTAGPGHRNPDTTETEEPTR